VSRERFDRGATPFFVPEAIMGKVLYVGSLAYRLGNGDLEKLFAAHGTVRWAQVVMDPYTGRSMGFGFVEMDTDSQAQAAIWGLNGREAEGRMMTVNEARPGLGPKTHALP
jgi:cold-inducible RNA-binding protein